MPATVDKYRISNPGNDKRRKLSPEEHIEVFDAHHKQGISMRKLALMYDVSRRLIGFICYPETLRRNLQTRADMGGSKVYYNKEKTRTYMQRHRKHKKELLDKGKLIQKTEDQR